MNSGSDGKLHESLTKLRHSPDVVVAIIRLKSIRPTEKAGSRRGDRRKVHEAYLIELDERTRRTKTDFLPKLAALRSLQVLTCFADNYLVVEATVNDLIAAAEFEFVEHILPDFEFVESTIEDPATNGLRASELSALNVPVFQHLRAIVQNYPWTALAEAHKEFEGAFRGMGVEQVVAHLTAAARVKPEADEFDHALGLAVRAVFQPAVKDAVLADIKHTLREAGAQSAGMYVRDPWSSGEFRPYILHGYTYPEPLQAFSDETRSRTALGLNDARDELYFSNAERAVPTDPGYIRWIPPRICRSRTNCGPN